MRRAEYRSLLTEAYDLDKPEPPPDELAFYRGHLQRYGTPALELMSGSGRFLLPLLAEGFHLDGVDASPDMLAAARRRATARNLRPVMVEQPLDRLDMPGPYAFAFCAAGSFGLLIDDAEIAASLAAVRRALRPDGRLLIEVETPAAVSTRGGGRWSGRSWRRPDGGRITLRGLSSYDPETRIEDGIGIYELFVDGQLVRTESNEWVRRTWTTDQITALLTGSGWTIEAITRAFSDTPATPDDDTISVLATPDAP